MKKIALAQQTEEVVKQVVSYGDLKLDRAEGIAKLYQRGSHAAEHVHAARIAPDFPEERVASLCQRCDLTRK